MPSSDLSGGPDNVPSSAQIKCLQPLGPAAWRGWEEAGGRVGTGGGEEVGRPSENYEMHFWVRRKEFSFYFLFTYKAKNIYLCIPTGVKLSQIQEVGM